MFPKWITSLHPQPASFLHTKFTPQRPTEIERETSQEHLSMGHQQSQQQTHPQDTQPTKQSRSPTSETPFRRARRQHHHHPVVLGSDAGSHEPRVIQVLLVRSVGVVGEEECRDQLWHARWEYDAVRRVVGVDLALGRDVLVARGLQADTWEGVGAVRGGAGLVLDLLGDFIRETQGLVVLGEVLEALGLFVAVDALKKVVFVVCKKIKQ